MVDRDVVYELDLKVKYEARIRKKQSDEILETVYEMIVERTPIYAAAEEDE